MSADKPMRGHGLMQAIARVHRVLGNKQSGLVGIIRFRTGRRARVNPGHFRAQKFR